MFRNKGIRSTIEINSTQTETENAKVMSMPKLVCKLQTVVMYSEV